MPTDSHHNASNHQGQTDQHKDHVDHAGHETMFRNRFWVSLVLTIPVLLYSPMLQDWFGFDVPSFSGSQLIGPLFAIAIFFYGGIPFLDMARPEIKKRQPGMMTLISMAISVAFAYSLGALFFAPESGFFWEMATLIDVMLLGHWFEMRSVRQASSALNELAKLMPDNAERIVEGDETETVSVDELNPDDIVLVRPGASVPVDGVVVEGKSAVNESMITGESKPVDKSVDDEVIGGTINGDGSLRVKVNAIGDDTALAGIMRLVDEAQDSKSNTQILADRAAGWLFYIAVTVAGITTVGWLITLGFDVAVVERAVTVLVIACPHALGLAIPLVTAISTSLAANNGILVRDRLALENARLSNTIVFDKTGTLTKGEFGVVDMRTAADWDKKKALALTTAIEGDSEHIIAQSIRRYADEQSDLQLPQVTDFEAIKGRGVKASYNGQEVYVGGPRLLESLDLETQGDMATFANQAGEKGQTVVYLLVDDSIAAAFALADVIRSESKQTIDRLHDLGFQVAMLTGDSEAVARSVAQELNIDTYFAEVLPEHKDQKIKSLQDEGKEVMMVGDGVNDAPALARADVGVAIGSGTDVAIESAGIILVQNDPLDIINIIELSQATYRKMFQNLLWATGYNIVALPLAAGALASFNILLSPAVGALLMSLSTVIVAINAQLLRSWDAAS
jgi:Cu2+-exporting ATPase